MSEEKDLHYFKFYYQKINNSTIGWSDAEFGAYVRLLIRQFDKGFVPDDPVELSRLITTFKKNWPRLSKKFAPGENPGQLRNGFMKSVRAKALKTSENCSVNGLKGIEAKRQQSLSERSANANDSLKQNLSHAHSGFVVSNSEGGKEEGPGEGWNQMPGEAQYELDLPEIKAGAAIELMRLISKQVVTIREINELWEVFKHQHFTGKKFYADPSEAHSHFINWVKNQKINANGTKPGATANRKSAGANELADRFAAKLAARGETNP